MRCRKFLRTLLPALLLAAFFLAGPASPTNNSARAEEKTATAKKENVYKGPVTGVSNKAKTISIKVGDKTEMVKFTDDTQGLEYAKQGEAAIIEFERRGTDKIATVIKPKLAKLPAGVTELQPDELAALVSLGPEQGNYVLIDSRPEARFEEGAIPTALSIPVPKLEKSGQQLLPADKDKRLIFYCGGPT